MTATSNALYVSINPAETLRINTEILARQEGMKTDRARMSGYPKPTAAEARSIKKNIASLNNEIENLKAALPLTYADPNAIREFIVETIAALDTYEAVKADFLEQAATNPTTAIEWRADKMVAAQFIHERMIRPLEILRTTTSLASIIEVIKEMRAEMLTECLRRVRGAQGSTSGFDNMIEACRADAAKDMYETKLQWPLAKAEFLAQAIADSAPIRNMYNRIAADLS